MSCHVDPANVSCKVPCKTLLDTCLHPCKGTCGECQQGERHLSCRRWCGRALPCGHECDNFCSATCPPCHQKCEKRCVHSVCRLKCGVPCRPCREYCSSTCPHHTCQLECHQPCVRPRCNKRCPLLLPKCKHRCAGLCGELCPTKCRVCHPNTKCSISLERMGDAEEGVQFIQLQDCRHVFEVEALDEWMDAKEGASGGVAVKLKEW